MAPRVIALCVPLLLAGGTARAASAPPAMCAKGGANNTGCTMSHYAAPVVSDAGACCARCSSDSKCEAWTFHGALGQAGQCYLDTAADCRQVAGVVGGCKKLPCHTGPPPPPPPPPPKPVPFPNYCSGKGTSCKNILYLVSDDMRSDWGAYGLPVVTPSLDALAKKSLLFEHAYCQLSVCAPSRMSFMTSKRPDTNRVWNFIDTNPLTTQATPGHFRDHGYITLGLGKTFHQAAGAWNANQYWSLDEQPYFPYESGRCPHGGEGGGHCIQEDSQIYDWHLRLKTIEYLKYAANKSKASGRPFYVMAGFRKPHAPWQAPQRMWDLYNSSTIALPTHKTIPTGAPLIAWSNQLEVALENGTSFRYDPHNAVPDWVIQDQRHAYYACVSYVDEHVGAILQTLDESGAADDTAVIFHADHGYHLGEHGEWEKKSNWDLVVRVSNCSSSVAVLLPLHSLTTASVAGTTHDSCAVAPEFFRSAYKRAGRINRRDANSCRHSRPPSPCGCGWRRHLAASAGISRQCLGWVGAWASEGASSSVPPVPSLWVQ